MRLPERCWGSTGSASRSPTAVLLRQLTHGNGILIDVMVGTFLGDTGAYFGGRLFGRHPLAPAISPKKTVEGLFCGMLVAIIAVFVAGLYQTWLTHGQALALGITIAVLGPVGDLFESLSNATPGRRTPARSSVRTAARSIVSTRSSSRSWRRISSGPRSHRRTWFPDMREIVLRVPASAVESVLDRLLPILPGGVQESPEGDEVELRMRGEHLPRHRRGGGARGALAAPPARARGVR